MENTDLKTANASTTSNLNSNALPPLPPLPSENSSSLVTEPVQSVITQQSVVETMPPSDVAMPEAKPDIKTEAPIVNLIPAPVIEDKQPDNQQVQDISPKKSGNSDKYNVLIGFLAVLLFVLLAIVGYLVFQIINLPTA